MTETEHDIEAYAVQRTGMASARCLTHKTDTTEQWTTLSAAAQGFRCDEGRNLRFITETTVDQDTPVPVMRDLSGLTRLVHGDAEARAYGIDDPDTRAWLWLGGGRLEPLEIDMQHMSEFDENLYAVQTWAATRFSGEVIATAHVRIDGRA
jgi:hypothetical protein